MLRFARDGFAAIGHALECHAQTSLDAEGLVLAPGFIDVHTHDDLSVIRTPAMLPKLSQGVTTVIVGNCGISASPVALHGDLPDPMNLLGAAGDFCYPTFASYDAAIRAARPAVNVGALVGHTALRNNHMDRLDRAATEPRSNAMRAQLCEALENGALGLSSGLAYLSANAATTEEVLALAQPLAKAGAVYTTHMRTEAEAILDAMHEAFEIGRLSRVPVIVSHLKCAGIANWGRSGEVLAGPGCGARGAADRLRLLSLCGRFEHARSAAGGRAGQDHDYLEHAAPGDCRADAGGDCRGLERDATGSGAAPAASGSHLSQHLRGRYATHSGASGNDDRFRWIAQRSAAPSSPVGNISARAGPL